MQESEEAAGPAENPLHEASGGDGDDRPPPTGRALREVPSLNGIFGGAYFLGADTLALVQPRTVTLHSLTDADAAPALVVNHSVGSSINSSAASLDGRWLCLGDRGGWLAVFDVAVLRAEPLSLPRHEVQLRVGIAGVAFNDEHGARLLTMCVSGPVEVRDARCEGLPVVHTLAFRGPQGPQGIYLLGCAGGLAVAVGGGFEDVALGAESKRARLWQVGPGAEEEKATLELTTFASAAVIRSDGGQVAIGGHDGAVRLFGGEDWEPHGELAEPGDDSIVMALAYVPDGLRLIAGRWSGIFVVYDVHSGAAVSRFAEGAKCEGFLACVAPAGDLVAFGGRNSKVVTLRELEAAPPPRGWTLDGTAVLAGAMAVDDVVVLGADSCLEVWSRRDGVVPALTLELGAIIGCVSFGCNPVAVRPSGEYVAFVTGLGKVVTCHALPSGEETFALGRADIGGSVLGLCWSPGGELLLVYGTFGTAMFDTVGAKLRVLSDAGQIVFCVAFSADGARLATAGASDKIYVRNTVTWEVTHELPMGDACYALCFDPTGECVAGWSIDGPPAGSVVVHRLDSSVSAQRFLGVNGQGALAFSADGRFLFAVGNLELHNTPGHDRMVVLSRATGAEAEWSTAFTAMALPRGTLSGTTLAIGTTTINGPAGGVAGTTHLRVVVGSSLVEVDVGLVRRAIDDNAWVYEKLVQLTDTAEPSAVGRMISGAPHCLNIRDAASGNTLLHHCANAGSMELVAACLASESAVFVPIANNQGKTALQVAFERREPLLARALAESLTPDLSDAMAALLTRALRAAALTMPEAVLPLLNAIEAMVLVEQATARTLHHRAEVIGLAVAAMVPIDSDADDSETFDPEHAESGLGSAAGLDLTPWNATFPSADQHATHTMVSFKALMLADLAGDPTDTDGVSAFHAIAANCDASVFDSKLLQYVVQYKFETNVLPTLRQEVFLFTGATLLASSATLASSRQLEGGSAENWVYIDVAQVRLDTLVRVSRTIAALSVNVWICDPHTIIHHSTGAFFWCLCGHTENLPAIKKS
jgi:WD40 repeat protein